MVTSEAEYDRALETVEKLMSCDRFAELTVRTPSL